MKGEDILDVLAFLFSRPVLYVTVGGQDEIKKITGRYFHTVACAFYNIEIFAKCAGNSQVAILN